LWLCGQILEWENTGMGRTFVLWGMGRRSESRKGEYREGEELSSLGAGGGGQSPAMGTSGKGRN
jgi:hypothetical protein